MQPMPSPPSYNAEPLPHAASQGGSAWRSTLYTVFTIALLAGFWLRFNPQIAAIAPGLAGPGALVAQTADPSQIRGLIEVGVLPQGQEAPAVAAMGLSQTDAGLLTQALQRGRLRLARLPLLDDSATLPGAGHIVQVSAGGYTRQILLTRQPQVVTFPIGPAGTISFSTPELSGVGIVGLGLSGPVRLPDIAAGQVFSVGVIAQ
jgi:hypothetical protein